jgi:hypothetical protein
MANVTTPNTDPPRLASRTRPRNHPLHAPGPLEKASINHHTENGFGKECSTRNKKGRETMMMTTMATTTMGMS